MIAYLQMDAVWLGVVTLTACLLTGAGVLPMLALAASRKARTAKRSAYERLGRQLVRLGLWFGLLGCGAQAVLIVMHPVKIFEIALQADKAGWPIYAIAGVLAGGLLLAVRSGKPYGWIAGCALVVFWAFLLTDCAILLSWHRALRQEAFSVPAVFAGWPAGLDLILTGPWYRPGRFAGLAGLCLCWGLAAGGGLGLLNLVLRRNLDDFGRDYYRLAASWSAARSAWGAAGLAVLSGLAAWGLARAVPQSGPNVGPALWAGAALAAVCALLAGAGWLAVAHSEHPMRLKSLMVFSCVAAILFGLAAVNTLAGCLALPG